MIEFILSGNSTGKSTCHGDSGGPLTVKNEFTKKHNLVGVVSWQYGCAVVSVFLLFLGFLIFFPRMDYTECMPRWPSTGLGLMELLLQMEAHLSVLPDSVYILMFFLVLPILVICHSAFTNNTKHPVLQISSTSSGIFPSSQ